MSAPAKCVRVKTHLFHSVCCFLGYVNCEVMCTYFCIQSDIEGVLYMFIETEDGGNESLYTTQKRVDVAMSDHVVYSCYMGLCFWC